MNTQGSDENPQCLHFSSAENSGGISDWRLWCRLCANKDTTGNINVFFKDVRPCNEESTLAPESEVNLSVVTAIKQYFRVLDEEELPKMLCTDCFSLVTSLVDFSKHVSTVQQMFRTLENSNTDLHSLRPKYGVCNTDEESQLPKLKTKLDKCRENIIAMKIFETSVIEIKTEKESIIHDGQPNGDNEKVNSAIEELGLHRDVVECKQYSFDGKVVNDSEDMEFLWNTDEKQEDNISSVIERNMSNGQIDINTPPPEKQECAKIETGILNLATLHNNIPEDVTNIAESRQNHRSIKFGTRSKPKYHCSKCPRVFKENSRLKQHEEVHLPVHLRKILPCPYCGDKFITAKSVEFHIKIVHMNERSFICEECGYAASTNTYLENHKWKKHSVAAPFKCEMCNKSFKTELGLKNHKAVGSIKYICPQCGLQLTTRHTLKYHLLVHSDVWLHKCNYCGRAFKRDRDLKAHLILHTGLKPYACDFCDRKFANGPNCRSHKKTKHPEELAKLEASGRAKKITRLVPKLKALEIVTGC